MGLLLAPQVPLVDLNDPVNAQLAGAWMMAEGAGSKVFDWSGRKNHGAIQSFSAGLWVPGRFGKTLSFGNTAVTVPNAAPFNGLSNYSHFAWINTTNSGLQLISEQNDLASGTSWGLYINGGVFHAYSSITAPQDDSAGSGLADGKWHFVGFTRDALAQQRVLYIDGNPAATVSDTQGGVCSPATTIYIGARSGNAFPFFGALWLERFHSRKLFPSEVRRLYSEPLAGLLVSGRRSVGAIPGSQVIFIDYGGTVEWLGTTRGDQSASVEMAAAVLSDRSSPAERLAALRPDSSSAVEAVSAMRRDIPALGELLATVRADRSEAAEYLATVRRDFSQAAETAGLLRLDVWVPTECGSSFRLDTPAPQELLATARREAGQPAELAALVTQTWTVPHDRGASFQADQVTSTEALAAIRTDRGSPPEWLATALRDTSAPAAWQAALAWSVIVPTEVLSLVQPVSITYGLALEWLASGRLDMPVPAEMLSGVQSDVSQSFGPFWRPPILPPPVFPGKDQPAGVRITVAGVNDERDPRPHKGKQGGWGFGVRTEPD